MIGVWLAAVLALQDPAPASRLTSAPDKRLELDFQHYYDVPELESTLQKLAAAYPEFLAVRSIGKSGGGRDLWLATVGDASKGELGAKPAIAVVSGLADGDVVGTEMSLYALYDLLQNHARDPRAGEFFARATLYVVPCADPDRRAELFAGRPRAAGEGPHLERDFPSAWDPWADGAGPYPLSTTETRALVESLLEHANVAMLVTTASGGVAPAARDDLPAEDRAAFRRALTKFASPRGALSVLGADQRPRARGSLSEFALLELGAFPFEVRTLASEGVPPPSEILDLGREHSRALVELARALPRLAFGEVTRTRLKSDLWQVEFVLSNDSALGGTTALGRERGLADSIALAVEGGKLVALGLRSADTDDFAPYPDALGVPRLAALGGGEHVRVRLMLQAPAGGKIALRCEGARFGAVETTFGLE
ncbi:MAG: hypothetical protein K8S98_16545 [Planctomycetes bacterium]|nr:hypothetical protein [Planctomycetota bacterium]